MTCAHRVGFGFDAHRFSDDPARVLIMGGVTIEQSCGLEGHSDADVVAHAICDALLGAAQLGDMGEHFPDTDPKWKGADSIAMLSHVNSLIETTGMQISNVDCTVLAEKPKLAAYKPSMQERLSQTVGAPVSIKATRAEKMGAIGRAEGVACWAVALLEVRC